MKIATSSIIVGVAIAACALIDSVPGSPLQTGVLAPAHAIIGRPLTPFSYAGVARRSVYRGAYMAPVAAMAVTSAVVTTAAIDNAAVVNANANAMAMADANANAVAMSNMNSVPLGTIVSSLPAGCSLSTINNVEYYGCNGVSYRATFSGNNLVYVVSQP